MRVDQLLKKYDTVEKLLALFTTDANGKTIPSQDFLQMNPIDAGIIWQFLGAIMGDDKLRERETFWNRKEGTFLFNSGNDSFDPSPDPALTNPLAEYSHDDGIAVIGGFVYRGSAVLALPGKYVFGDLTGPGTVSGRLFYLDDLTSGTIKEFSTGSLGCWRRATPVTSITRGTSISTGASRTS